MKIYHECKKNLFNVNLFKSGMQFLHCIILFILFPTITTLTGISIFEVYLKCDLKVELSKKKCKLQLKFWKILEVPYS
ncbi:hypothetical protein Avbf_15046 [Armadillidium vulgare]|nr:hypothetical protein Avbf_15046 [Armadillidium vulgare]